MKLRDALKIRDDLFLAFSDFSADVNIKDGRTETYNPSTGVTVTSYSTDISAKAFLKSFKAEQIGGEILSGDVLIIVNTSTEIRPNALVSVGTITYNVINSSPVTKNQGVIQRLHCRGNNA